MKSIYRSARAKKSVLSLYDEMLYELDIKYQDIYVETRYGRSHVIECGNLEGEPLLLFHGGNATSTYNLKYCEFLLPYFHIYAVDTIGHPGKSAERSLSPYDQSYGRWAVDVIHGLKYEKMICCGGSYGAGILVKAMCVEPEAIEKSFLLVPAAISNASSVKSVSMALPMLMYWITNKESWFKKCLLPMAIEEKNISDDMLRTAKCSIDNAKIKSVMPQNETTESLRAYKNPVLVYAAERDCLFPGEKVIAKVKQVWENCRCHLLEERGHICELTEEEKQDVVAFLLEK